MLRSLTEESQDHSAKLQRVKLQRRGVAKSTIIRISVLLVLFLGVVIFGWFSRPDLVRNYLGIMAPAKNADQALLFANEDLFLVASDLAHAQVDLGVGGKEVVKMMDSDGGHIKKISKAKLTNSPDAAASQILSKIKQSRSDVYRAQSLIGGSKTISMDLQNSLYKNIDLSNQIMDALEELKSTKLGEALEKDQATNLVGDIHQQLKKIQEESSPKRRQKSDPSAPKIDPDAGPGA